MKWDEADANREKRKAENRKVMLAGDAEAVAFLDELMAAFPGSRLEWWKCGEVLLGRAAYEESVREARKHRARVEEWERVLGRGRRSWRDERESQRKPLAAVYGGRKGTSQRRSKGRGMSGTGTSAGGGKERSR